VALAAVQVVVAIAPAVVVVQAVAAAAVVLVVAVTAVKPQRSSINTAVLLREQQGVN
jgi:hypothetical protein